MSTDIVTAGHALKPKISFAAIMRIVATVNIGFVHNIHYLVREPPPRRVSTVVKFETDPIKRESPLTGETMERSDRCIRCGIIDGLDVDKLTQFFGCDPGTVSP